MREKNLKSKRFIYLYLFIQIFVCINEWYFIQVMILVVIK